MTRFWLFVTLSCTLSCIAAERLNLDHTAQVVDLSNVQITPDGRSVVVAVSRPNLKANRTETEIVRVDVDTRAQRVLTRQPASQPRLSSDGRQLAFLRAVAGKNQIFVLPMDGGEAMQVSAAPTGVQVFAWRPDGKALAYTSPDEPSKREGEEKDVRAFDADVNYLTTGAPVSSHLWLVSADGGPAKRLTAGPGSFWGLLRWSPDGKRVACGFQPALGARHYRSQTTRLVDVETGTVAALPGSPKLDMPFGFSPKDGQFAYTWPREGDARRVSELWVLPAQAGQARNLTTALDANVNLGQWTTDGRGFLLPVVKGTRSALWYQPLDGPGKQLDLGALDVHYFLSMSEDGKIVFVANEPSRPNELYLLRSLSARPERLTEFNGHIAKLSLGRQEAIRWRSPDGLDIDGVVTYPPGYQAGKPLPLVVTIRGGPFGASTEGFDIRGQWLAAHGWIVFAPNYRGGSNLGDAVQTAVWKEPASGPARDIMAGVDLLVRRGVADPNRMAVSGWSYGGFLSAWLLGTHPDRWRAGVAGAAIVDPVEQYVLSDIHSNIADDWGGSPFTGDRLRHYREQAPITHASKIKAPTLLLHNTGDQRVPITGAYMLYHVLHDNGVKAKLVAYPTSGHQPGDPVHARDVLRRWADWIGQHI